MQNATRNFTVKKTSNVRGKRKAKLKIKNLDELCNDEFCIIYVLQLVSRLTGTRKIQLRYVGEFFCKIFKRGRDFELTRGDRLKWKGILFN
jgi:hypothetical protein